jgi:hypothetical protein
MCLKNQEQKALDTDRAITPIKLIIRNIPHSAIADLVRWVNGHDSEV